MTAPDQSSAPELSAVTGRELAIVAALVAVALAALLTAARFGKLPDLIFGFLAYAFLLAAVWAVAVRAPGRHWDDIGLRRCDPGLLVIGGFAGLIWVGISTAIYSAAGMWETALAAGSDLIGPFRGNALGFGALILLAVPTAAVVEEIFYRGLVYGWLRQRMSAAKAVPASAFLFTFSHIYAFTAGFPFVVETLALAMLLALLFELSRSLWPGILCHALYNLSLIGLYLLN